MRPPTLACLISYRGDLFHGFQRQGDLPTVELALRRATVGATGREPIALAVAGRTDAGVHARAQVVSFRLPDPPPPDRLRTLINAHLPPGILVRGCALVGPSFHARSSALAKRYRYRIERSEADPALQRRAWRLAAPVEMLPMIETAKAWTGRRDCSPFRTGDGGGRSPICRIDLVRVRERGRLVVIDIEADRFLRRMARAMVGRLVAAGSGAPESDCIVAPARGLFLQRIYYAAPLLVGATAPGGSTASAMVSRPETTVSTLSAIWA
ncbi:MAG: tRNA pseudouridine(38-40) synthase TruA [Deltaproteobacteria bacterium]|nr:tRNA pseudouridine(38-40) synthase TruA [Deltaproteobacteria bacterium]